jgi:hypothetical protein
MTEDGGQRNSFSRSVDVDMSCPSSEISDLKSDRIGGTRRLRLSFFSDVRSRTLSLTEGLQVWTSDLSLVLGL